MGSKLFNVSWPEVKANLKTFLHAMVGAALVYIAHRLSNGDFGNWTEIMVAIGALLSALASTFFSDTREA